MRLIARLRRGVAGVLVANVGARIGALVALALSTLVVARTGGPVAVGILTLLRVLPGLVGVVLSSGLPGAVTYFLAGPHRDDRRLPATLAAMAVAGGAVGTALWIAGTPLLGRFLFQDLSLTLVALAGVTVLTQLLVATVKSCAQGSGDLSAANMVIVNEELLFLPGYAVLWLCGVHGDLAIVGSLLIADVGAFAWAAARLARRGFLSGARRPSLPLAREVASYGMRAQVGGIVMLLNLRLDFILLNVMAGPAVLGVYAIASKFAELLKIPGLALAYVLYPEYAKDGPARAAEKARTLIPKAALWLGGAAAPMALSAALVIPAAYGAEFRAAVAPAQIIVVGLALEGVAGVITGFLYGIGRPGLNSWAMAAGLAVTVALDLVLIPSHGAIGAAVASAVAYLTTALTLLLSFWRVGPTAPARSWDAITLPKAGAG